MYAMIVNPTTATEVPAEQRAELLYCHWYDVSAAHDRLQDADGKATQLARLRYLRQSLDRLEAAIVALGTDAA